MNETILIVDDEERIRSTVRGILADEGYRVLEAENGRAALRVLELEHPSLVILDIWMPEMDGIEFLRSVHARRPEAKVVVISGHGNIETAVKATQLGAFDFIEKPFSLDSLLATVSRAVGSPGNGRRAAAAAPGRPHFLGTGESAGAHGVASRTLVKSVVVNGHGLHSGVRTGVILHPAPPGTGIVFEPLSSGVEIPALVEYVDSTGYATTLHRDGASAKTVEHLLAALHGFGITNLRIKIQGEIPILDGSAIEFCRLVEAGGVVVQPDAVEALVIERPVSIGDPDGKGISLEPGDGFEVDYTLEYPAPVGRERFVYRHTGPEAFSAEIAPARTFGFLREIATLEQLGLAGGGRLHNCILIGDEGVLNTTLRFPCEFARHKILDVMGDFMLLGRPVRGRVVARMSGHTDNIALLRQVRAELG